MTTPSCLRRRTSAALAGILTASLMVASPAGSNAAGASSVGAGPAWVAPAKPDARAALVLNRLAFGPSADTLAAIRSIGLERWIDQQLTPARVPEQPALLAQLAALSTQQMSPGELFAAYGPQPPAPGEKRDPEQMKTRRAVARIVVTQAQDARILRAAESTRQLQEVMVAFWFDHFNIFAGKGLDHLWVGDFENGAIRPNALGRFRDLLGATAHHPAMLFYLDNWQNTVPGSIGARGKKAGINENYAREIMELHTLGVTGGYSQDDVVQLARILTGWGITRPRAERQALQRARREGLPPPILDAAQRRVFVFDPERHDTGDKKFLGHVIAGRSGPDAEREGEEALDLLARSPATARHLSFELAQYFVADKPDPALVDALTAKYLASDGDIAQVLRVLFASKAFWNSAGAKYKTPYQYVISAVRASGLPVETPRPLLAAMAGLGQPLYGCQTPDGWKNTEEAWLNPDASVRRADLATQLGRHRLAPDRPAPTLAAIVGGLPPAAPALPLDPAPIAQLLGPALSPRTLDLVRAAPADLQAAMLLGSPDFMRR